MKDFRNDAGQVIIDRNNKVWSTDITYIKLEKGFVYLVAIIDWHSKKILSWKLSNTMDITLVVKCNPKMYQLATKKVAPPVKEFLPFVFV